MAKQKDFDAFLSNIEPSQSTVEYISSIHTTLRKFLLNHPTYGDKISGSFLSGSYAKHTCIRPKFNDGKRDVDIVLETNYTKSDNSIAVIKVLYDTLKAEPKYQNTTLHSHSVGIEMEGIEIDVVPIIYDEASGLTYIGSSKKNEWKITNPKGHIKWSSSVNKDSDGRFIPAVKMFKWWKRAHFGDGHNYPKGITLEKMIADSLPSSSLSTGEYFIETMRNIILRYASPSDGLFLPDPCLPSNNLLNGMDMGNFYEFIDRLNEHYKLLKNNGDNNTWRAVLGEEFPVGKVGDESGLTRGKDEEFIEEITPVNIQNNVRINCDVTQDGWRPFKLRGFDGWLRHRKSLDFYIENVDAAKPYRIFWKVRNVGPEAERRDAIRGAILQTDEPNHHEATNFYGPHFVECYIIKDGVCVARDRIDVPIGHS